MKIKFDVVLAFLVGFLLAVGISFLMPKPTETVIEKTVTVYVVTCPCNPCVVAEMDSKTITEYPVENPEVDSEDGTVVEDDKEKPDKETTPDNEDETPSDDPTPTPEVKTNNGNHYGNDKPDQNEKDIHNSHNGMDTRLDFENGKTKGKNK